MSSQIEKIEKNEAVMQPVQDEYHHLLKLKYAELWFMSRFKRNGAVKDIDRAVGIMEKIVDKIHTSHEHRLVVMLHLVNRLDRRLAITQSRHDLNRIIEVLEEALETTFGNDPAHTSILGILSSYLFKRFNLTRSKVDINRVIDVLAMKVAVTPDDHPDRPSRLTDHATVLAARFDITRDDGDLNEAVRLSSAAVLAVPRMHQQRSAVLLGYAKLLSNRASIRGSIRDLDQAIKVCDEAMMATPLGHPDRVVCQHTRSILHHRRFAQTGSPETLDAAIQVAEATAMAFSQDSQDRFFYWTSLARLLEIRFETRGSLQDLNRAITLLDDAVDNAPQSDTNRIENMSSLSTSLGRRFQETRSMVDINRAIELGCHIVRSISNNDPSYVGNLVNAGNLAGARYGRTGLINDLNLAIDFLEKAVGLPNHLLSRASAFPYASVGPNSNEGKLKLSLGMWLAALHERTGAIKDLDRSICLIEEAIAEILPGDNLNRALHSHQLSRRLLERFQQTQKEDDIDRALNVARTAVDDTPNGHPYKSVHLTGLVKVLSTRYESGGLEDDIEEAITLGLEALDLTATDQANGAMAFNTIGGLYGQRFQKTENKTHLDEALLYFNQAVACTDSPPAERADSARHAARILADQDRWDEACEMLETVIELLPHVSPRLLTNSDKQHHILLFSGMASFAAAMALQAQRSAVHALQLLEAGRGLIGSSLLELRSEISLLREEHPDIAERFDELRKQLDARSTHEDLPSNMLSFEKETQGTRLGEADEELSNLIVGIRDYDGFERFLLPPSREDLLLAAARGPVVTINMNYYRCDALLIQGDRIWSLPLEKLKETDINEFLKAQPRNQRLDSIRSADTLEWLWEAVVEPVLLELGYCEAPATDQWPQVWWILTGPLILLPIHAAGRHAEGKGESTLDRVMSSYSSSIKSLINGRSRSLQDSTRQGPDHALLVAMQNTPGESSLPFAEEEVKMLARLLPALNLKARVPIKRERCKADVIQGLRGCKVFHFAGHGSVDSRDPTRSKLLLEDWQTNPLTVENLRDLNMHEQAPFLGFLSACSTSANMMITLIDEGIHLAGALQLAGFRHVIGTLWEVRDPVCVKVTRIVYETIREEGWNDATVCRALHKAVRKIREECLSLHSKRRDATLSEDDEPWPESKPKLQPDTYWIPYIHFGV